MQKSLMFFIFITLFSGAVKAQFANSKWTGVMRLSNEVNISFVFGKDTLTVFNLDENSIVETMTFSVANSTLTVYKVSGQSDCSNSTIGKYQYEIMDNVMVLKIVDDVCDDRSEVLNNLKLKKSA
jgi:hypothetical protein